MFAQSLVLFLLSGFWFLTTVNSAPHEFLPPETGLIFTLAGAVLSVQALMTRKSPGYKTPAEVMPEYNHRRCTSHFNPHPQAGGGR